MDDTAERGPARWRRTLVLLLGLPGLLLSVLLLLVVVGILLRDRIVNSAPVRKEISFALYQFTGRDITLQGEIEIEDFPWVTVVVGPGTFGNPPDFTGPPLLSWRQIRLRVHYSTLYERAPLLDRITVTGLVADLRRDRDGRDNFSDIGPVESSGPPEAALSMPVIELRDASLRYTDETRSTEPLIAFIDADDLWDRSKLARHVAAHDVVAAARADGFWEFQLKTWDTAAGVVVLREAGARVTDMRGEPWTVETADHVTAGPALAV